MRDQFKRGVWHREAVNRIQTHSTFNVGEFLGPEVVLVPMPGSAPEVRGSTWSTVNICVELMKAKLGSRVGRLLQRREAVPKSAFITKGSERPSPERHYETLEVAEQLQSAPRITLVDDVITRGSTMLGAAHRLQEAYPNSVIFGFALIRTRSGEEIDALIEPVVGTITYVDGSNVPVRKP